MAHFSITEHVIGDFHKNHFPTIKMWLAENVGDYYGRGEGDILDIGSGWEIYIERKFQPDGSMHIGWYVDITDDLKSTMFALVWS